MDGKTRVRGGIPPYSGAHGAEPMSNRSVGWNRRAMLILAIVVMACGLIWWRALLSVLMTALSGLMLAVLLLPVTIRLEARMKPGPAAALAMILLIGVVLLFLGLVFPALADQAELLFAQLPIMLEQLNSWITSANELLVSLGAPTLPDVAQSLKDILKDFDISIILRGIMHTAGGVFGRIAQALLIPMIAFYFLRDREMFCHGMTLLIPIRYRRRAVWTAIETRRALILYLRGHALISLFVGGLSALGLLMIGVNAWLALGVWIALTDFVPYFGPIIGMVPIVLFGPAIGWNKMLWSLVLILVIQQIETNWLSPRVISEHMGIHPVTVLIVLALGNLMFGIWGLILSLPIMIAIKTMIRAISSIE